MANPTTGFGFSPIKNVDGSPFNGGAREFYVPSSYGTAVGTNSFVALAGSANSAIVSGRPIGTLPTVNLAAVGAAGVGIVVGVDAVTGDALKKYVPASTGGIVYVMPATNLRLQARVSGAFTVADVGQYADLVIGSVDTTTGIQQSTIDSTTIGTGTAFRILGLSDIEGNEYGTNAIVDVEIVKHQYANNASQV